MVNRSPEFQLIQSFFQQAQQQNQPLVLGIGDDCALFESTAGMLQAVSIDTSIADRHFPADADAFYIATRALNSALSDLAAMGAQAKYFTLALSLPSLSEPWLKRFSQGLFDAANRAQVQLIGGDTTKSEVLTISVQVHGEVPNGKALLRSGAKQGDNIYVTGQLANGAAGLALYRQGIKQGYFFEAYLNPKPQLALGIKLREIAHSCIDISDGLLADLGHILHASQCGATIDCQQLPIHAAIPQQFGEKQALTWALTGGDDYQLCFTSSYTPAQLQQYGIDASFIGNITEGCEIALKHLPSTIDVLQSGFDHFL